MALLLIMTTSRSHPTNPEKDALSWKRGDIVEVFDDSAHDGDLVRNPVSSPNHVLVRITGVTKAQIERLMQPQFEDTLDQGGNVVRRTIRRRKHRVLLDAASLPSGVRSQLINNRYVEVSWAQVRNFIENKVSGTTEGATP